MLRDILNFYRSDTFSKVLLTVFFIVFSLGQLEKVTPLSSGRFFAHDLIAVVFLLWELKKNPKLLTLFFFQLKKLAFPLKALLLWIGISLFFNFVTHHSNVLPSIFYLSRLSIYTVFIWSLFPYKKLVMKGIIWSGIALIFYGFLQYLFLPDTRFLFFLGWDDHYYRLISTMLDPGFTGCLLVLFFWLIQSQQKVLALLYGKNILFTSQRELIFKYALSGISLVALALTFSRASYLAFGISSLIFLLFQLKKSKQHVLQFLLFPLFFLVLIPFLPHPGGEGVNLARTSTVSARVTNAQEFTQNMKGVDWVIGNGVFTSASQDHSDQYDVPNHAHIADNWLIFILTSVGVVGFVLVAIVFFQGLKWGWKKNKYLLMMLVAVSIHGLFSATIVYPFVVLFLGCSFVSLIEGPKEETN